MTLSGSARIPRSDLGFVVQNHVQQGIMDLEFSVVFDKTQFAKLQIINGTIIGRNGVVCCLRMTALRPVIVVRSSLQKPATSQDATVRASIAQRLQQQPPNSFLVGNVMLRQDHRSEGLFKQTRWATLSSRS